MKIDYEKISQDLAEAGFVPGCLLRLKKQKYFWKDVNEPTITMVKLEDGTEKDWLRGKDFVEVPEEAILMYLGLQKREECKHKAIANDSYRLICFLYKQEVVWWDVASICDDVTVFSEKFEVINCGEKSQKTKPA